MAATITMTHHLPILHALLAIIGVALVSGPFMFRLHSTDVPRGI